MVVSSTRSGYCVLRSSNEWISLSFWGAFWVFLDYFWVVSTDPSHLIRPSHRLSAPPSRVGSSISDEICNVTS